MSSNDSTIEISLVADDDANHVLAHLAVVATETDFLSFDPSELEIAGTDQAKRIDSTMQAGTGFMVKACLRGSPTIIGLASVHWENRSRVRHVGTFALTVVRSWWNRGVGRRLAERAMAEAWASSITRLELRVREDNARAIALYDALGFHLEGRLRGAFLANGRLYDELILAASP